MKRSTKGRPVAYPPSREISTTTLTTDPTVDSVATAGPLPLDHPLVGTVCVACRLIFGEGDFAALVPVGPGADPEARQRRRDKQIYTAVAVALHLPCQNGEEREHAKDVSRRSTTPGGTTTSESTAASQPDPGAQSSGAPGP